MFGICIFKTGCPAKSNIQQNGKDKAPIAEIQALEAFTDLLASMDDPHLLAEYIRHFKTKLCCL